MDIVFGGWAGGGGLKIIREESTLDHEEEFGPRPYSIPQTNLVLYLAREHTTRVGRSGRADGRE